MLRLAASPQPKSLTPQSIIEWMTVTRRQIPVTPGGKRAFERVRRRLARWPGMARVLNANVALAAPDREKQLFD
jgi:hypothetical protein